MRRSNGRVSVYVRKPSGPPSSPVPKGQAAAARSIDETNEEELWTTCLRPTSRYRPAQSYQRKQPRPWRVDEIYLLINAVGTRHHRFLHASTTRANRRIWDEIVEEYTRHDPAGRRRDPIKSKWRGLENKYQQIRAAVQEGGEDGPSGQDRWVFYDAIDAFLGSDLVDDPPSTLASTTNVTRVRDDEVEDGNNRDENDDREEQEEEEDDNHNHNHNDRLVSERPARRRRATEPQQPPVKITKQQIDLLFTTINDTFQHMREIEDRRFKQMREAEDRRFQQMRQVEDARFEQMREAEDRRHNMYLQTLKHLFNVSAAENNAVEDDTNEQRQ